MTRIGGVEPVDFGPHEQVRHQEVGVPARLAAHLVPEADLGTQEGKRPFQTPGVKSKCSELAGYSRTGVLQARVERMTVL
jgi:hypothetical protein